MVLLPFDAVAECSRAPLELIWAEKYRDGGTIAVTVTDSTGCVAGFSQDWAIGSETLGRIYYRAVPEGDGRAGLSTMEEERKILDLLCLVADANMPRAQQNEILDKGSLCEDYETGFCRYCGWLMELLHKAGRR